MQLAVTGVVDPIRATYDLVMTFTHCSVPTHALTLSKGVRLTHTTDMAEDVLTRIWKKEKEWLIFIMTTPMNNIFT